MRGWHLRRRLVGHLPPTGIRAKCGQREPGVGVIAAFGKLQASGIGRWAGAMLAAVGEGLAAAVGQMAAAVGHPAGIGEMAAIGRTGEIERRSSPEGVIACVVPARSQQG